jgi:hypothetical protein
MPEPKDMDLRDWFAGQALIGLLASVKTGPPINPDMTLKQLEPYSRRAYDLADAMLLEKKRRPAGG